MLEVIPIFRHAIVNECIARVDSATRGHIGASLLPKPTPLSTLEKRALSNRLLVISALALALASVAPRLAAQNSAPEAAHSAAASEGFLRYHPDLRWRKVGLERYEAGRPDKAFDAFVRSSRYADKGSQAMVAEMYWNGDGTSIDRARAYAWMDLAAERGYKDFTAIREHYWSSLDERERERALSVGKDIYAEYGDDVAKPRLERKIDQGRRQTTGSRTGFKGALTVLLPGNGNWIRLDGEQFYNDKFWQPERYFEWQDQLWREPYRGRVEVGAVVEDNQDKPARQ